MKKIIFVFVLLITSSLSTFAVERGYRGFVDVFYSPTVNVTSSTSSISTDESYFGFTTTHGYQCANWCFIGGGLGIDRWGDKNYALLFADVRFDQSFSETVGLYENIQLGKAIRDSFDGGLATLGIGLRVGISDNKALNFGVASHAIAKGEIGVGALRFQVGFEF